MANSRMLTVTINILVRDMTNEEFEDCGGPSDDDDDDDFEPLTNDFVRDLDAAELREIIEASVLSADNPEMMAGSGLYVVTEQANVTDIQWSSPLTPITP